MLPMRLPAGPTGLALLVVGLVLLPINSAAQSFSFYTLDVPSSTSTTAFGISPAGDIVGTYNDARGGQHGFLLSHGQFTTIDVPGWLVGATGTLPTAAGNQSRGVHCWQLYCSGELGPADFAGLLSGSRIILLHQGIPLQPR